MSASPRAARSRGAGHDPRPRSGGVLRGAGPRTSAQAVGAMTRADQVLVDRVLTAARARGPIAVLGDLILDRWWFGDVERLSREAPAPVVRVGERTDVPGGAANTAVNLAALGAHVRLVGAVGDDEPGLRLLGLLNDAGVDTAGVVVLPGFATTAKTRLVGG